MTTLQNQSSPCVRSNYRGSELTRRKVQEQIRRRFGEEAASAYDPLRNCLTVRLWNLAGYRIKPGEQAIKSMTLVEKKDRYGNVIRRYLKTVCLFYITQVEPIRTVASAVTDTAVMSVTPALTIQSSLQSSTLSTSLSASSSPSSV